MIDAKEIKEAIKNAKFSITDKELNDLMNRIDNNENTQIDYTEFIVATIDLEKFLTDNKLHALFNCFDVNHTG